MVFLFFLNSCFAFKPYIGLQIPSIIHLGLQVTPLTQLPKVKLFLEGSYFQWPVWPSSKAIYISSFQVGSRIFFIQNFLFFQSSLGYRNIHLSAHFNAIPLEDLFVNQATLTLHTFFLGISTGISFCHTCKREFQVACGLQLPLLADGNITVGDKKQQNDPQLSTGESTGVKKVAKLLIPEITFVRILWDW